MLVPHNPIISFNAKATHYSFSIVSKNLGMYIVVLKKHVVNSDPNINCIVEKF